MERKLGELTATEEFIAMLRVGALGQWAQIFRRPLSHAFPKGFFMFPR